MNPVRAFAIDAALVILKVTIVVYPVGLGLGVIYLLHLLLAKL